MNLGNRIENEIEKKGLTRSIVADLAEIPRQNMTNIINKGTMPSAECLYKIARVLGVSCEYLLTGEDSGMSEEEVYVIGLWRNLSLNDKDFILDLIKVRVEKKAEVTHEA